VALLLLSANAFVEADVIPPSITVNFDIFEGEYRATVSKQSHLIDDVDFKMFGKHLKTELKADGTRYGNADVKIFNASFSENNFEKFPELVCELFVNLRDLYMEKTSLKVITASSFDKCTNLENIYFGDDEIISVDSGVFLSCSKLVSLKFNGNEILKLASGAFEGLESLQVLTLISNNFSSIDSQLFKSLTSLKELSINDQPLAKLPENLFENLSKLEILNLNNNELLTVPSTWFNGKTLESVDLSYNKIRTIDSNLLKVWSNQASLNLINNVCIDADLGKIGTDVMTIAEAGEALESCFFAYDDELKVKPINDDSDEDADDSADVGEEETPIKQANKTSEVISSAADTSVVESEVVQTKVADNDFKFNIFKGSDEVVANAGSSEDISSDSVVSGKAANTTAGSKNPLADSADIDSIEESIVPNKASNATSVVNVSDDVPTDVGDSDEFETDEDEDDEASATPVISQKPSTNSTLPNKAAIPSSSILENSDEDEEDSDDSDEEVDSNEFEGLKEMFDESKNSTSKVSSNSTSINSTLAVNTTDSDSQSPNALDIFEIDDSVSSVAHDKNTDEVSDELLDFSKVKTPVNSTVVAPSNATRRGDTSLSGNSEEDENPMFGGAVKKNIDEDEDEDEDFDFPTANNSEEIAAANKTYADIVRDEDEEVKLSEDDFKFPEIAEDDSLSPFDVEEGEDIKETPIAKERPTNETRLGSESTENDYKKYEVANSRFYVSADNQYTAVIYGVSDTMRFIKLNHLSGFSNVNVSVVFIRECIDLKHIPVVLFKRFKNIQSLSVNNCGIVHMGSSFLNECGQLQHLDMRFNKIESVKGESVKNCANLETLNLSNNEITAIESSVFNCNPELNVIIDSLRIGAPKKVVKP
jgi:Leucine-rich repeat (LRR) protein